MENKREDIPIHDTKNVDTTIDLPENEVDKLEEHYTKVIDTKKGKILTDQNQDFRKPSCLRYINILPPRRRCKFRWYSGSIMPITKKYGWQFSIQGTFCRQNEGTSWAKKGWWHLNPNETKIVLGGDLSSQWMYYLHAHSSDGTEWGSYTLCILS